MLTNTITCKSMEPRTIALRNGVELPRVGLGTFRSTAAEAAIAVHAALGAGLRHIDTASIYKNQEAIGKALKTSSVPRDQVHGVEVMTCCTKAGGVRLTWPAPCAMPCDVWAGVCDIQDLAIRAGHGQGTCGLPGHLGQAGHRLRGEQLLTKWYPRGRGRGHSTAT